MGSVGDDVGDDTGDDIGSIVCLVSHRRSSPATRSRQDTFKEEMLTGVVLLTACVSMFVSRQIYRVGSFAS